MASLPVWAVLTVSIGTPLSAFLGAFIGHHITRQSAKELEIRSRREEVMRTMRWAAEKAVSADEAEARLGFAQLAALSDSDLLDKSQQQFIDAALGAIIKEPVDELRAPGEGVEVVGGSGVNGLPDEADQDEDV